MNSLMRWVDTSDIEGCWPWMRSLTAKGYGQCVVNGRPARAHREVYKLFNGPITKDMNQIVQCIGTRGSNLQALYALQTQFIKELEELTKPVKEEGPKVIYVLRYLQPCDCSTYIKCFETLEGAHKWWHINRHSVISGKILKETLN